MQGGRIDYGVPAFTAFVYRFCELYRLMVVFTLFLKAVSDVIATKFPVMMRVMLNGGLQVCCR